jgi:DNA protecting protein DprA
MVALRRGKRDLRESTSSAHYRPPVQINSLPLPELLQMTGRKGLKDKQLDFLRTPTREVRLYFAGDIRVLSRPSISIVGTRQVSDDGRARARRLASELIEAGLVVVTGLARGVDTVALTTAMAKDGAVAAVIGTPLDKAYPAENARLQEGIYERHLLLTPFKVGETIHRSNFPKRNRVMAAISDATIIVEASDTSGTLHQAAECQRLGRWLFILRSVANNPSVTWPARFIKGETTVILDRTEQVIDALAKK